MANATPKAYPTILRLTFVLLGLIIIALTFHIMSRLSAPSLYVNAVEMVKLGPVSADNIKHLAYLNFKNYLYLKGPIVSATSENETGPLFIQNSHPALLPSTFVDQSGGVEILANKLPLAAETIDSYMYKKDYHLLGWRTGTSGFALFAIGENQKSLLALLEAKAQGWQKALFINGIILSMLVISLFWLLNMAMLSTPYLETVQLLIVNVVFLVLFYSVLFLSGYPLIATLFQTLGVLIISNIIFIPLALFIRKKETAEA